MKIISLILALVIAVHAGCGIQCLVHQASARLEKPACHEESSEDTPDGSGACGLPQPASYQIAPLLKGVALVPALEPPSRFSAVPEPAATLARDTARNGVCTSRPPDQSRVLRI